MLWGTHGCEYNTLVFPCSCTVFFTDYFDNFFLPNTVSEKVLIFVVQSLPKKLSTFCKLPYFVYFLKISISFFKNQFLFGFIFFSTCVLLYVHRIFLFFKILIVGNIVLTPIFVQFYLFSDSLFENVHCWRQFSKKNGLIFTLSLIPQKSPTHGQRRNRRRVNKCSLKPRPT